MMTTLGTRWSRSVAAVQAAKGWSDDQLAAEMGIARSTLNRKKNGRQEWTASDMQRLRELLSTEASDLRADLGATLDNRGYLTAGVAADDPEGHTL